MTLKAAVIGYGFGGRMFHAPPITRTPGLELAAIVSRRADEIARDHPGARAVASPEAVFADSSIALVAITTPNAAHYPLAAQALAAGKHVVVDKPFALTGAEARDLAKRAEAAGRLLSVFHNFRWYSDYLTVKRLVAEGTLGDISYFESHFDRYEPKVPDAWREKPAPASGTWWDLGPHLVDQALQLFGRPESLFADLAVQRPGGTATDYFHVLMRYGKRRVVLTGSSLAPQHELRFVIHGAKASFVKYGIDMRRGPDPRPGEIVFPGGRTIATPAETADDTAYYAAVRDAILGDAANPVPPHEAIAVMDILELAEKSSAEHREIIL